LCLSLAIFCLDRSRVAADDGPLLPGFENASTDEPAVEEPTAEPVRQVPRPIAPPPSAPSRNVPSRSAPVTRGLDSDIEPPVDDRSSQPGQSSRRGYSHGPRGVGSADAPAKPDAVDRQPASPSNGVQPMDPSSRRGPSDPAVPRGQGVPPQQRMQPNQQQRPGIGGKGYDMRRSQPSAKPGTQPERAGPQSPPRAGWGQPFGRPNNQGSQAPQRQPNSSYYRSAPPQTRPYPQAPSQSPGRATQSERSQARGPLGWQLPGAAGRAPKSSAIPNQPAPSNRSTAIPPWETNGHGLR
jgi:hypothetical protein